MSEQIEMAMLDILMFYLGMRPNLTEHQLRGLVKWRLSNVGIVNA